jgi:hypothetical protein
VAFTLDRERFLRFDPMHDRRRTWFPPGRVQWLLILGLVLPFFGVVGVLEGGLWLAAALPLLPLLIHGLWLDFGSDPRRARRSFARLATPDGTALVATVGPHGVRIERGPDVRYDVPPRALRGVTRVEDTAAIWFRGGFSHFIDGRDDPEGLARLVAEVEERVRLPIGLPPLPNAVPIRTMSLRHLVFVRLRWAWVLAAIGLILGFWVPWVGAIALALTTLGIDIDATALLRPVMLGRVDEWVVGRSRGRQLAFRASALVVQPLDTGLVAIRLGDLTVLTVPESAWPRVEPLFEGARRFTP